MASVSPCFGVSNIGTLFPNLIYSLRGKVLGIAENNNQAKAFSGFSDSAFLKKRFEEINFEGVSCQTKEEFEELHGRRNILGNLV